MKKVIYFFVCFFITTTWGCTNEKIMESNQELVKALGYEGSNSIGDAFIKDLMKLSLSYFQKTVFLTIVL